MAEDVQVEQPLQLAGAAAGDSIVLESAHLDRATETGWAEVRIVVRTDALTAQQLEAQAAFHNRPEQRMEQLENGFDLELPVRFELRLEPEQLGSVPSDTSAAVAALSTVAALREPDAWSALMVWQDHPLPALLGGGVQRVGYRTVHSAPRSTIEALQRRGPVSRTVVEAMIESGLPVEYDADRGAFLATLGVGAAAYACQLTPDEESIALTVVVEPSTPSSSLTAEELAARIARTAAALPLGTLELVDGTPRYTQQMSVDPVALNANWVINLLRAGVSVVHQLEQQ